MLSRWLIYLLSVVVGVAAVGSILLFFVGLLLLPQLPSLEALTDYQPRLPLRVYSAEGALIGEFGVERRTVVTIDQVPPVMRQAILAAEDDRFYQHGGVDYQGVLRAAWSNVVSGGRAQGASTITMQVAREFYLSREKTLTRKFTEVLLAWKIEASLTKDQILELYVNQINLGQRAYGFASAARTYFGKDIGQLDVAEAAMLAGIPKAPSRFNPVVNPQRARQRQQYVLRRMRDLKYLTEAEYAQAVGTPVAVRRDAGGSAGHAEYVAEMARQLVADQLGETAYTSGMAVRTTIRLKDQEAAYAALRRGVLDYDHRHGYRGPEHFANLPAEDTGIEDVLDDAFQDASDSDELLVALVLAASPQRIDAIRPDGQRLEIGPEGLRFAQRALTDKAPGNLRIRRGALIRVARDEKAGWQVTQLPQVEAAFVSLDPSTGAIRSLVGGFDFQRNKFNHVTQAQRQPGSSFKPFIYSAALEKGFTPATIVEDAPLFYDAERTGSEAWEPKNYDGKYEGPMRLRLGLAKSKNMISIRVLEAIGPQYAQDYARRFGFDPRQNPAYLTMALGAGSVTPAQMAAAYAVFANGGYRVDPYLIERIEDAKGNVVSKAEPTVAGEGAERVVDARNTFVMTTLLREVVRSGTAARAMALGRGDLAGKTGTTNDHVDAWFCGFGTGLVGVAWIGFDQPRNMGNGETGSQAALPIWMGYMGKALRGVKEAPLEPPEGVVSARIDPDTGLRVPADVERGIPEYFYAEYLPRPQEAPGFARLPPAPPGQLPVPQAAPLAPAAPAVPAPPPVNTAVTPPRPVGEHVTKIQ